MRYSQVDKLFTVEGMIVGTLVLVLTLLICRPRKPKAQPTPPGRDEKAAPLTMNPDETHSASRLVHFTDRRPPHEVRGALERVLLARFDPVSKEGRLEYHATSKSNSLPCNFRLVFESAQPAANHYLLHLKTSWAHTPPPYHDHHRTSAGSWFDVWCRDLTIGPPVAPEATPTPEYRARVGQSLKAEAGLADVAAIQSDILTALRNGASFATAHKEGGTHIGYAGGTFFRKDFGESPAHRTFSDETAFLAFLRQFFHWEITRSVPPDQMSEETAWRLILRLLNPS